MSKLKEHARPDLVVPQQLALLEENFAVCISLNWFVFSELASHLI
nr:hypothetical protein Iba_chr02cCG5810 [Ipomoea batatas]GMC67781.1 hypothetical protein Iba_chr02fCG5680 [Ipomoea batatas]